MDLKMRFWAAMAAFVAIGIAAGFTLDGKMRLAVLIFIAGLALRTAIHYARARGDQ